MPRFFFHIFFQKSGKSYFFFFFPFRKKKYVRWSRGPSKNSKKIHSPHNSKNQNGLPRKLIRPVKGRARQQIPARNNIPSVGGWCPRRGCGPRTPLGLISEQNFQKKQELSRLEPLAAMFTHHFDRLRARCLHFFGKKRQK